MSTIGQHADKLYADNKWHEALEYLEQHADTENPDLLWRLMRINYRVGKHMTADRKVAEQIAAHAMELSERALKINDKHFLCQKVLLCCTKLQQCSRVYFPFHFPAHYLVDRDSFELA